MMGHKICFNGETWLIIPKLSLFPFFISSTASQYKGKPQEGPAWSDALFCRDKFKAPCDGFGGPCDMLGGNKLDDTVCGKEAPWTWGGVKFEVRIFPLGVGSRFLGKDIVVNIGWPVPEPELLEFSFASRFCRCCNSNLPFFRKASSDSWSWPWLDLGWFSAELGWAVVVIIQAVGGCTIDTSGFISGFSSAACKKKVNYLFRKKPINLLSESILLH